MQKSIVPSFTENQLKSIIKIQRKWRVAIRVKKFKKSLKQIKKKYFTANELLSSEKTYCNDLKFIIKQVLQPSKSAINDQELHQILFSNITQIYLMHHVFLFNLQQVMNSYTPHLTRVSQPLLKLFTEENFVSCYTNYCYNYPKADKIMKLLTQNNSAFKQILRKSQPSNSAKTLQSYMIKPVQRLCKYELMLKQYYKNMMPTHVDYEDTKKTIAIIQSLVDMTNSQVEEFLFRERQRQLRFEHPEVFNRLEQADIQQHKRKLVYEFDKGTAGLVHLIRQQQSLLESIVVFTDFLLLLPKNPSEKPLIAHMLHVRKLDNMKYFKNLLQVIDHKKYYTFEFREEKERDLVLDAIQKKTSYLMEKKTFSTVDVLGTQRRESFFKFYTVYIVEINQNNKKTKIYPRFKNLLKVQDILVKKNLFQQLNLIPLQKESPHLTLKSRTIEKRKLHIRQFLQRLINHEKLIQMDEIRQTLEYFEGRQEKKKHKHQDEDEITILLPSWQTIKVHINSKTEKVKDLKQKICHQLEFIHNSQFEIFELRNKNYSTRRLMYDNQSISAIYQSQNELSINPFSDNVDFMFSRHYYLAKEQQLALYKLDFIRLQLQLSVIKMQILTYGLEEDLMITFMCLFAMYINMPLEEDKISALVKEVGRKTYKITAQQFKLYFGEVQKIVSAEEDQLVTIPFLIIKILTNNRLYQAQQFEVQIHKKCFKSVEKQIPGIEEQVVMAIKLQHLLLLTIKEKHLIKTINYEDIQSMEMHPNGIIFTLTIMESVFRIKTTQGYEISKLITIYKQKKI